MDKRISIWTDLNGILSTLFSITATRTYTPLAKLESITSADAWTAYTVLEDAEVSYEANPQTYTENLTFSLWLLRPISNTTTDSDIDGYVEKAFYIRDHLPYKKITSNTLNYNITDVTFADNEPFITEFLEEMSLFASVIVVNLTYQHQRTSEAPDAATA